MFCHKPLCALDNFKYLSLPHSVKIFTDIFHDNMKIVKFLPWLESSTYSFERIKSSNMKCGKAFRSIRYVFLQLSYDLLTFFEITHYPTFFINLCLMQNLQRIKFIISQFSIRYSSLDTSFPCLLLHLRSCIIFSWSKILSQHFSSLFFFILI